MNEKMIINIVDLKEHIESEKDSLEEKYRELSVRINEMRKKYRSALDELQKNCLHDYEFRSTSNLFHAGTIKIESVYNRGYFFVVDLKWCDRDDTEYEYGIEIPYDEQLDSDFVGKLIAKEKPKYLKIEKRQRDDDFKRYKELKKRFEEK